MLKPLRLSIYRTERVVDREPRKVYTNSLISVGSSFYSVPRKYIKKTVWIYQTASTLFVYDSIQGDLIASHQIALIPGSQVIDILEESIQLCFDIEKYSTNSLKESYQYIEGKRLEIVPDIMPTLLKNVTHIAQSPEIKKRNLKYYSSLYSIVGGFL